MLTRRKMLGLGVAGAAVVGVPLVATPLLARARAEGGLPLTVVNSTGRYANSSIHMYITGYDPVTRQMGYVRSPGRFTPASFADNGSDGFLDIAVPLAEEGATPFVLPMLDGGRIYFSIDGRLRFKVVDGGGKPMLQEPAGSVESDPNFGVLWDFWEFTYNPNGMHCNTTMVDMFSIPIATRLVGAGEHTAGKLTDGGRDAIFAEVARQPGYERLIIGDGLRVIAPGHGIVAGRFSPTYFDGYIVEVWDRYRGTDLRVSNEFGAFTGRVGDDGRMHFDGGIGAFDRPTTMDVLMCNGTFSRPNDASGKVAAALAAGFNRSVLDRPFQPVDDRAAFYQHSVTNHYSRILHNHSANGRVYGFPYDDIVGDASYIQDSTPREVTVTLTPFAGGEASYPIAQPPPAAVPAPAPTAAAGVAVAAGTAGGQVRVADQEIAASGFDREQGVRREPCGEGGENLCSIANGDWVAYHGVEFGDRPMTQFVVRVASGADLGLSGLIQVRLDSETSPPIGTIAVASTGGWQRWLTIPGNMAAVTGRHDVFLTFASGQPQEYLNIRWLRFGR
ncbi:beta-1,3-glucanase family protein [Micromonospora sp. NPDC049107]|uniref:beta-1,3-glucanase family protein n=1 Tax=Micromonospora sp. NPDC049107 TaxID=3154349 RepID=UPI0034026146